MKKLSVFFPKSAKCGLCRREFATKEGARIAEPYTGFRFYACPDCQVGNYEGVKRFKGVLAIWTKVFEIIGRKDSSSASTDGKNRESNSSQNSTPEETSPST